MNYEIQATKLLCTLGFKKDIGYKKGWYLPLYTKSTINLTSEESELYCFGILYRGTDSLQILKEELNSIFKQGL